MPNIQLESHQIEAVESLSNGRILKGGVGSGKSRVAIAYYYTRELGGDFKVEGKGKSNPPSRTKDLYIITTAKKRDSLEWEEELASFALTTWEEDTGYQGKIVVDSWNNIRKYTEVKDAFFIFDEQKLVGYGAWVKAFLQISKHNNWIILSATPGDVWMDYVPVFIANGFFQHKTDFTRQHVVYSYWGGYPKVERYVNTGKLQRLRKSILVDMPYERHTRRHIRNLITKHDENLYKKVVKDRWNFLEERPIKDVSEQFQLMRRVVNQDRSRLREIGRLLDSHPRLIVFYNFNYELDALRGYAKDIGVTYAEWNGQKHMEIPQTQSWLYLVQYTAGSEGWNCIETDAMIFYSLTYSYKQFEQAQGRIDRLNTPYVDLYYYVFRSRAWIDTEIMKAIKRKQNFNESAFSLAGINKE